MKTTIDKAELKKQIIYNVKTLYRRTIDEATPQQVFQAVSYALKDDIIDQWIATHKEIERTDAKTLYYLSMEFLMGRALGNNILNLCAQNEVKEVLEELGFDLNTIEDQEPDPALGNGGLTFGSMLLRFSCNTWLPGIWLWNPLQVWYVCTEDRGWLSEGSSG